MPERVPGRDEMLKLHEGPRTEAGARENIRVGVQYLAAWLGGKGAVPLYNLMEDAATAEICRTQLWQWLKFEAPLDDGRSLTRDLFEQWFDEEVGLLAEVPNIAEAARLMHNMIVARRPRRIFDAAGLRAARLICSSDLPDRISGLRKAYPT